MNLKIWHLVAFSAVIITVVVLLLPSKRDEGILLARSGKVEEAAQVLKPIIDEKPLAVKPVKELAQSYIADDQSEQAISLYEDYLNDGGDDRSVEEDLIALYIANYQYEKALALLAENKEQNLDKMIELSVKMGELGKAEEYSREKLEKVSDKAERIRILKDIEKYQAWQLDMGGVGKTREELAESEGTLEGDFQALDYFVWKNNKEKMRIYAQKVGAYKDLPIKMLRVLRTTWISLKDADNALKAAREITELPEAEYTDWVDYLTLLEWTGKKDELLKVVQSLIKEYPDKAELYWRELALLPNDGMSLKRAEVDEKLYEMTGNPDLLVDAITIYRNNNDPEKVEEIFQKIVADSKFVASKEKSFAQRLLLAEAFWAMGQKDKALKEFNGVYRILQGEELAGVSQNDFWAAIEFARNAELKLEEANLYVGLYKLSGDVQLLRDARDVFRLLKLEKKALRIDARLFAANELSPFEKFQMLKAYKSLGRMDEAQKVARSLYAAVLAESSEVKEDEPFWTALDAAAEMGDDSVRAKILVKFYRINDDPELLREAALILSSEGRDREAILVYEELEKNNELSSFGTGELLRLYEKTGMENKLEDLAVKEYVKAMSSTGLDKERDLYYQLLDILPKIGRGSDRIKLLEKYAEGGDVESVILLAEYYSDNDMLKEAKNALNRIINDKKTTQEEREQAELQLANIISIEYYAADDPEKERAVMREGRGLITKVIKNLERELYDLSGEELKTAQETIDAFRMLEIRFAFLDKDYIEVDQLVAKLYNPDAVDYLDIAGLFYNFEEENSAKRYFEKIDNTKGFNKDQYSLLGFLYSAFGENELALKAYKKADSMANGLDKDIRLGMAAVYGRLGDVSKQYDIVDFYTSFNNAKAEDWLAAADARAEHNDLNGEYAVLEKAVERRPESALLIARITSLLVAFGKIEEAVEHARRLEGLKVEKTENDLLTVGYGLLDVGQVREAGRMFAVASNIDSENMEARLALARYFVACFQYPQAHRIYKDYLKRNMDDGRIWYEYAVLKKEAGFIGWREAFVQAKTMLQDGKQNAEAMSLISSIDSNLNRRDSALKRAMYARDMEPDNDVYRLNLAELYNSYNYPEYGKQVAQSVAENDFNSSRRNNLIAEADLLSRRFIEGIDELKKVLSVRSDDSAAQLAKGYSEVEIGEWIKGSEDLIKGEAKSRREQQRSEARYQHRATGSFIDRVILPELEE